MADKKAVAKLRESVDAWNAWRRDYPNTYFDLAGANLSELDLIGADLSSTDFEGANLTGADLSGVDLTGTDLRKADLTGANLSGVDLTGGADLSNANLTGANLAGADLTGALVNAICVEYTNFLDAKLDGALGLGSVDFSKAFNAVLPTGDGNTTDEPGKPKLSKVETDLVLRRTVLSPHQYQTMLIRTPLGVSGLENPTLVTFTINLGARHNELAGRWPTRVLEDQPDGWQFFRPAYFEDVLAFMAMGDDAQQNTELEQAIRDAIDHEDAFVYFGSVGSLLTEVLEKKGSDRIAASVQLGEEIVRIIAFKYAKSIIVAAVVTGTAAGLYTLTSEGIPRIGLTLIDRILGEDVAAQPGASSDTPSNPANRPDPDDKSTGSGVDV